MLRTDLIILHGVKRKTRPFLESVIMLITMDIILSDLIKEYVLNKFDHKNLNLDTDEFNQLNPSAENIAVVIWNILREKIDRKFELKIRLYETERNFVEYNGN
jgi:6-pyruvoyl-tetrahydropterin synthase